MKNIAKRKPEVDSALQRCKLERDLCQGTPAMKAGRWIRQNGAETQADYELRVDGSILFNGYKRTNGYLTGQVFKKDLEISEDSPLVDLFERMKHDVDLQGNDIRTFAQKFFSDALNEGARMLLVQYPTIRMDEQGNYWEEETGEWRRKTAKVDQDKGWRPYFVPIGYDQILGWRYEYENGVKVLTQLRLTETVTEKGELDVDDEEIKQVRVFERGSWSTWRKSSEDDEDSWTLYDEGKTSIKEIPLAVFMPGEQLSDLTAIPALEDLAYLNLRHWQATADQHVLMSFVRRPPWFGRSLVNDGEAVPFGPGKMVHSSDPAALLQSVGVDPSSVEAGRGEMKDLEERMGLYGLIMLTPALRSGSSSKTATQSQQETNESSSQLHSWAQSLKDCFDQALKFAAMFEGIETGSEPEVELNIELQPGLGLDPSLLITAFEKGLLPRQVVFDEFKRRGMISDVLDWEDVLGMLQREDVGPTQMPEQSDEVLDFVRQVSEREQVLVEG